MDDIEDPRPNVTWPWLYAIVAVMLGLLAAVEVAVPDGPLRRTLECVVTMVMVVAMGIWVRVNRVALEIAQGVARRPAVIASSRTPRRPRAPTRR